MRLALLHADQEFITNILASLMDSGHVVHAFREEQDLLRDIGRESFDLLLIDGTLFGAGFQRFLRRLWALAGNGVALMFINCENSETRLAEAFALGADDFILRGVGGGRSPRGLMRCCAAGTRSTTGVMSGSSASPIVLIWKPGPSICWTRKLR